jgi:hypothetical protein
MTHTSPARVDGAALAAGIALIVLPLVGVLFKVMWPGWYVLFLLFAAPFLAIGYIVQLVISAQGFLWRRGVLRAAPARRRALWAAWLTSGGAAVLGLFFVDGGDSSWGSAFMYIVGAPSNTAVALLSYLFTAIGAVAWIGGWVWLLIEWIAGLVRRRRA